MRFVTAGLALAAAAFAAPALAQQVSAAQAIRFLDKDADGKCSLNEYLVFQAGKIAQFDANGDGALQLAEFTASLQGEGKKNADRSFGAFNVEEKPDALTQREFLGYHAYVFRAFVDTDRDGFMSEAEWSKIMGL